MYARAVEDAQAQLVTLRRDEVHQLAVGAVALGASLAMTAIHRPLVFPLFVGGMALWLLGIRSIWRHWELVDRLADDRDAYVISDVLSYAARDARMSRRRANAKSLRCWASLEALAELTSELERLARDLENAGLELGPASAIACRRLLTDPTVSPLLNGAPAEDIRETIVEIEKGFSAQPATTGRAR
jgi:hypothetical protein